MRKLATYELNGKVDVALWAHYVAKLMYVCVLMYTELTSSLWGFSEPMKQSTEMNKLKRLRIPTSGRSISWLCASAVEGLNHGQPGTNSAG